MATASPSAAGLENRSVVPLLAASTPADALGRHAVLTRPAGTSPTLARSLAEQGWQVHEWPALSLTPVNAGEFPLPSAYDLVVFVSGYAARCYVTRLHTQGHGAWPNHVPAATVGPASADAFRAVAGSQCRVLHPELQAERQDSEALWAVLQAAQVPLTRVLLVRGGEGAQGRGRNWLAQQLAQAGAHVHIHAAYRRDPTPWPAGRWAQLAAWHADGGALDWLFTSSEGVQAVLAGAPAGQPLWWPGCRLIATHPRIADCLASHLASAANHTAARPPIVVKTCKPSEQSVLSAFVL